MVTTTPHTANPFKEQLWWGTLIDLLDIDLDGHKRRIKEAEMSVLPQTLPKDFVTMRCPTWEARELSKH